MPIRLNSFGGGSVTVDVPSTASNFTANLPAVNGNLVSTGSSAVVSQGMLAAGVAGNGPAFSAFLNSSQSLTNNTWTKININTETFDTNNMYDTSLFRFTPNVAGYYFCVGALRVPGGSFVTAAIYKNGSIAKQGVIGGSVNNPYSSQVSGLVFLNGTTDFIELFGLQAAGSTLSINTGLEATYFDAFLARAA